MLPVPNLPERLLLGPGPSAVHPRVLGAMAQPMLGHLDPVFLGIMNELMELLRNVFETKNPLTIPMSGTGSAGMETAFVNLVEPGDRVLVGVCGVFGQRMVDVAERCGAEVIQVSAEWGAPIQVEQIADALKAEPDIKIVALVHAETSTGVWQPLQEVAQLTREHGALFLVDAVTSLGGIPVGVDANQIDVCYSGTQKCLSAPPGLAPITFSERALQVMEQRTTKIQSWYLDVSMIRGYWGKERLYHHTAPISMDYALLEALRLLHEEGLEQAWQRHLRLGKALQTGLFALGLELHVDERYRLPQLTTVRIPEGIVDTAVRAQLLSQFGIEIAGGLGSLKSKVWRVGLMGYSCNERNVLTFLAALGHILKVMGLKLDQGAGVDAALEIVHSQ